MFELELTFAAQRHFANVPPAGQATLRPHIDALAHNPRPHHAIKVGDDSEFYYLHVKPYLVFYFVEDEDEDVIFITRIGHEHDIHFFESPQS